MDKDKYYDSGKQKLISEDYEGAIADLSKAIEFNPTDERAFALRAESKFNLAVDADDDDLLSDSLIDYKKALELGSLTAEIRLENIEESLRENAKSESKEAKDCAKILKEHFEIDISKDKFEEKKIIKFDVGENSIEFLTKSEFELLDYKEIEEYINGKLHLDDKGISWVEYEIRQIAGFTTDIGMGDKTMDRIWDECIKELFPEAYKGIEDEFPDDKESKLDSIYDFINELEDEDWNKTRVFFISAFYSLEDIYKIVLKKAENASKNAQIIITKEQRKSASDLCLKYANESSNHMDNLAIIALALGVDIGITDKMIFEIVNGDKSIKAILTWFITVLWNQEDSNDEMFKPFIELKAELNNDIKPLVENIDWLTIERLWNGCLTKFGIELKD